MKTIEPLRVTGLLNGVRPLIVDSPAAAKNLSA